MSIKVGQKERGETTIIRLVKKAQKGNDEAFLTLFQQYEVEIYRVAYVYVKNKEDALDVVQEVAYQSFKKIDTLNNPEYFKTWLMKITMNCAINLIKKNSKVVLIRPEYEEFIETEEEDIPLALSLQDLIDGLTVEEKSVVLLRFYQNHTFKEIAELLDMPLGTAKSVLYRAIKKLRNKYFEGDRMNE
ncbi:sigma-70 family RNA polymerase sigma factor [Lysinibacillus sphaericus]|uniref:sigma-70 family RNA polymerase sigma factor n=1 Tax=Lysinibacillus sphaericus TaxID=1421 RepID=UPI001F505013|nr:sigma-70 family RNA polymerase sigma factor [Lysinibacillus sphaericus]